MKVWLSLLIIFMLLSCQIGADEYANNQAVNKLSRNDKIRFKQYMVQGAKLYSNNCTNCHQDDGKGLGALYPPLAKSDYLLTNLPRATCIIKYGQQGEIIVNGVSYNQVMPAASLTNLEIAEILTYISNSWDNEAGLISVKEVNRWMLKCDE